MEKAQTIKEAFLPLAERLLNYENGNYHTECENLNNENGFITDIDFESLIKSITINTNRFPPEETYAEAIKYEDRINSILQNLKPRTKEYRYDFKIGQVTTGKTSERKQNILMDQWKFELTNYLDYLQIIKQWSKNSNVGEISNTISLPADFTIKALSKFFEPKLSNRTVAFLLHYLQEIKVAPNYSNSSLAAIGKLLFGRDSQNIRAELTHIHDYKSKKELIELKDVLQSLNSAIDKDIINGN